MEWKIYDESNKDPTCDEFYKIAVTVKQSGFSNRLFRLPHRMFSLYIIVDQSEAVCMPQYLFLQMVIILLSPQL